MNEMRSERARRYRQSSYDEKLSQREMCLDYLIKFESITPLEALEAFGCFRLSAVIFDLREEGYKIKTNINKDGKPYAIYELVGEEE